ncbi:MAG TPA: BadF/BadG/BcrA/BcrD ATPase family protein [Vicinamibacterales bacterium]|nr:BadF/BadG/BcrA/BcrD ATPase family protein [Vicinamibacterales bacterium]
MNREPENPRTREPANPRTREPENPRTREPANPRTREPENPFHVLGLDAGGTKTVCQLADDNGIVLGESRGGGANLQAVGELAVEKVLHDVMEQAIGERRLVPAAICLGIAGVDRPEDARVVGGIMKRIGYKARILVVNDALVALEAGAPEQPAVVIIAGTGSIAYGRNATNQAARAGGWGYVLGDEGSGYWIGRAALRAVLRESDRRGPATALTPLLLRHFDVARPQDLIHEVYQETPKPATIAALAQCVQQAFVDGDGVAIGILRGSADQLEQSGLSVARRLEMVGTAFPFVLAGGIFRAVPWLHEELARRLPLAAPRSRTRLLEIEPAAGAVRLALAEARGVAAVPAYKAE